MNAETNLQMLLALMEPELQPEEFVYSTVLPVDFRELQIEPWGWFREAEGITLILEKSTAIEAGLTYTFPSRLITLTVHSSLDAVGFLAIITERLAKAGISVNAISAYYHDHLFVPIDRADQAMEILRQMMADGKSKRINEPDT
jgi:hypothetical protein